MDASDVSVLVNILVQNVGDLAAGETAVNVIAPRHLRNFRWSGPRGEERENLLNSADSRYRLTDADGKSHAAQYLSRALDQVSTRKARGVFFVFKVEVPSTGVTTIPLRVTADADELPEGSPEESAEEMVRVALLKRGPPT